MIYRELAQHHINEMVKEGESVTPLYEIADVAASLVKLEVVEDEKHFPGDRLPRTVKYMDTACSSVDIDITDSLQDDTDEWGEGSFIHEYDGAPDVRVNVQHPVIYVVDAEGKIIPGARIMAEFTTITIDTP